MKCDNAWNEAGTIEGNFMKNRTLIKMKNSTVSWELDRCLSNSFLALITNQEKSWHSWFQILTSKEISLKDPSTFPVTFSA